MERWRNTAPPPSRPRRYADQPSFSSTLLDAIYKSMDEPDPATKTSTTTEVTATTKKQYDALQYYYYRPSLAASYRSRAAAPHATTSSSSDCSSYGGFSSSEAESSHHRRLRPIRTSVTGAPPAPAPEKKSKKPGSSIRSKLRDLRKPASPGARDSKRYSGGRGVHINLRRAEKARNWATKIPAMVDNLISRTFAWENARNKPFLYDGGRLVSVLEEYKLNREQKEEDKRRYRDHKKLENMLLAEKEAIFGSKPTPKRTNSLNRKTNGYRSNGNNNGLMTPVPRRQSLGSATPELLTPRSYSGRYNRYFGNSRRLSATTQLNFVSVSKEDSMSTFTSISGSEPESPSLL